MVSSPHQNRHGRACPGHPRLLFVNHKDVDVRDKPGHDETTGRDKTKKAPAKPGPLISKTPTDQRE
jgi:hypothetical protein